MELQWDAILSHFCKIRRRLAAAKQDLELFFMCFGSAATSHSTLNRFVLFFDERERTWASIVYLPSLTHSLSLSLPLNNHPRRSTHGLEVTEKSADPCLWWHGGFPWVLTYARGAFGGKNILPSQGNIKGLLWENKAEWGGRGGGDESSIWQENALLHLICTQTTALM